MKQTRTSSVLRALVLTATAVLLCWPLTVASGIAAAALGGFIAALTADTASRTRLRLASALTLAFAVAVAGTLVARGVVSSTWLASWLGPITTLWISEALRWATLTAPLVFALRLAAARKPWVAVFEVVIVATAFATAFAAHRDGMVHRPLAIGDWAWSRGIDPAFIFLILGGFGTLLLAALLISEERRQRLPLHFGALFLVALVLLLFVRVAGLPKPQPAGELGLTGDPETETENGEDEDSGAGGGENDDQMDDLPFKDEYRSAGGDAPVAVVVLHDDYSPPSGVYYFRQSVFSQFNGRRLVQSTRDDVDLDIVTRFPSERLEVRDAPTAQPPRMPLKTTTGLLVDHVKPFALDSPAVFEPTRNPNPVRFQRAFVAWSHVQNLPYDEMLGRRPGDADWNAEQWDHYTEAPSDARYSDISAEIIANLRPEYRRDPLAQALAIKSYLDENGIYSRRNQHTDSSDPTGSFLFGDLTGYCVHFAHAAAYLLRSRGLPARVAAGYAVPESARGGGSAVMIRGLNAHAWPEVFVEDVGWVVVDPAPQQSLDDNPTPPDQALQRMLGEMLRQPSNEPQMIEEMLRRQLTLAKVAKALALLLAALLAIAALIKIYRRLVPRFATTRQLYRVGYRAALDRLAELGLRRHFGESRERFAARAGTLSPAFGRLTSEHLRSALGARRTLDAHTLRRLTTEMEGDLRHRVPGWRRAVGLFNPFSWILTR